jgi:hypothetical protein
MYGGSGIQTWTQATEIAFEVLVLAGDLATGKVMLFTDSIAYPVTDLVLDDLTVPVFTGYALSAAITWGTSFLDLDGHVVVTGQKLQFLCTADGASPPVTGAAIVNGAGTDVITVDIFRNADGTPNPVTIQDAGDALDYVPKFTFPNSGQNDN